MSNVSNLCLRCAMVLFFPFLVVFASEARPQSVETEYAISVAPTTNSAEDVVWTSHGIFAGGCLQSNAGNNIQLSVVRFDADGKLTAGPWKLPHDKVMFNSLGHSLMPVQNGLIVVGRYRPSEKGTGLPRQRFVVARLTNDLVLDETFGNSHADPKPAQGKGWSTIISKFDANHYAVDSLFADNQIYLVGRAGDDTTVLKLVIACFNSNGIPINAFGTDGIKSIDDAAGRAIASDADGNILVADGGAPNAFLTKIRSFDKSSGNEGAVISPAHGTLFTPMGMAFLNGRVFVGGWKVKGAAPEIGKDDGGRVVVRTIENGGEVTKDKGIAFRKCDLTPDYCAFCATQVIDGKQYPGVVIFDKNGDVCSEAWPTDADDADVKATSVAISPSGDKLVLCGTKGNGNGSNWHFVRFDWADKGQPPIPEKRWDYN